jgi:hypothetical protein
VGKALRTTVAVMLIAAFTLIPRGASAAAAEAVTAPVSVQTEGPIRRAAQAIVPAEARLMRQVVATTNESKIFLGLAAGGAMVAGLALLAYGSSSSCKGKPGNTPSGTCERLALAGGVAVAGGGVTLLLWSLSR